MFICKIHRYLVILQKIFEQKYETSCIIFMYARINHHSVSNKKNFIYD